MAISKIIYKSSSEDTGTVWMDVTQKTVTASSMLNGITALKNDGTGITGNIASKSSSDLTASGATVTAPAGYYASAASKSVTSGSATTPATTVTANPSISVNSSTGVITATASATKSVTPTVSAGYVSSGTAGTITVSGSNTSNLTTQAATTYHPSITAQSIAAGKYLTGAQTISAVTMENLTAANIKKDVVVKIGDSSDDDCVTSITGTYEGSGSSGPNWETVYIGKVNTTADWGNGNYYRYITPWYESIQGNSVWRITWDDVQYECTATWGNSQGDNYALGNYTLDGGSGGTQYPFFIQTYYGTTGLFIVSAVSGTHHIIMEKQTEDLVVWETVHTGSYGISADQDNTGYFVTDLEPFDPLALNSIWRITYNGTQYTLNATQTAAATMNADYGVGYAVGNYGIWGDSTNTGEPFIAGVFNWSGLTNMVFGTAASSGNVTIRVERMAGNLIPKTITANGTYNAEDDGVDGYSSVTVNVSGGTTWEQQYVGSVTVSDWGEQLNYISLVDYFNTHNDFSYGETYRITWKNGAQYTCTAEVEIPDGDWTGYVLGNGELWGEQFGNNEPFIAQRHDDDLLFPTTETANTTFTLTIEKQVPVVSGLEYEEGTYTPATDTAQPTISFANNHSTTPVFVMMSDTSSQSTLSDNSCVSFSFDDPYRAFNSGFPYSTSALRYENITYIYKGTGSSISAGTLQTQYNSDNTTSSSSSYSRYWVTESNFKPYANSSSRYWRSGRTYKWIAVWAPTS